METVATASKLHVAICVILCLRLLFFLSFAHQTAREIAHPRGIQLSVMVVTRKCNAPVYKPPPHVHLPNASMHKRGTGFYGIYNVYCSTALYCCKYWRFKFLPNPKDGSIYSVGRDGNQLEVIHVHIQCILCTWCRILHSRTYYPPSHFQQTLLHLQELPINKWMQ